NSPIQLVSRTGGAVGREAVIGSRDFERVQAKRSILSNVHILRVDSLPGKPCVEIKQHIGSEYMRATQPDYLDAGKCVSILTAQSGISSRRPKRRRIKNIASRNAVAAEERRFL